MRQSGERSPRRVPSRIHSSTGAEPLIRTSNGSPAITRLRNAGGRSLVILSVTPAARSNSWATSASTVAIALVVQTTSSGRCCAVAGVGTAPAMAANAIVRPASRLTIRERQRGRPSAQCDAEERM